MVLTLAFINAGAQTIARIDENDSLLIKKKLNEVVISGDHLESKDGRSEMPLFGERR